LIAQSVGDINSPRFRINRDAGRTLEETFSPLQAPDRSAEATTGIEDKDLPCLRIRYVDVVLSVNGNTLRGFHRALILVVAVQELIFVLGEVKDVNAFTR
jgi:hypothetical protein